MLRRQSPRHESQAAQNPPRSADEIQAWMRTYLGAARQIAPSTIDLDRPLDEHGIDSAAAMRMIGDLEDYLGRELSPSLPYEYPTIRALSAALAAAPAPANAALETEAARA